MAAGLTLADAPRAPNARRAFGVATLFVLLAHAVALSLLGQLMRPPSVLKDVAPAFYTRSLAPQAPAAPPAAAAPAPPSAAPVRPSARIARASPTAGRKPARRASAPTPPPDADASVASADPGVPPAPEPAASAAPAASAPVGVAASAAASAAAAAASSPATTLAAAEPSAPASPASAASAPEAPHLKTWPADTRLSYRLGGNYRGELKGNARVLWQRDGARYQSVVQLDVGLLLSSRFTSQGDITPGGLRPEVYEEQIRQKRRGVRLGEDVRLNNGERVPRPDAVQDAASQFVELAHRFATGQLTHRPGQQINFWLARPGGVDEWTYDVVGEETVELPRLGAITAIHLKPRPIAKPRGSIQAEIWFAPSLQYLPVRIRLTQEPDTFLDLLVETIEQR